MNKLIVVIVGVVIIVALTYWTSPTVAHSQVEQIPKIIINRNSRVTESAEGAALRQEVEINRELIQQLDTLEKQASLDGQLRTPFKLNLNLFEAADRNVNFIGSIVHASQRTPDTSFFRGTLSDVREGEFQITVHKGLVGLRVFSPGGTYSLRPAVSGQYIVEMEAERERFSCKVITPRKLRRVPRSRPDAAQAEDGSLVDVLIVYTTSAKVYYQNNVANLERAVREMEAVANLSLRRSLPDVTPALQLRFVAIEEVPNTIGDSLEDYAFGSSGASLRAKREAYKADLVIVIRRNMSWAGQAFAMCDLNSPDSYRAQAYGHVRVDYLEQIKTLPHELGHLFGGQHDPRNVDSCSLYTDSRGHFFSAPDGEGVMRNYGTLLSYANAGNRIPGYSNPDVTYQGVPTGTSGRNNAHAIRDSRRQLANYKVSSDPLPQGQPPVITMPPLPGTMPGNTTISIAVTITDDESVTFSGLYWQHTNSLLNCPGTGGFWKCSKSGNVYTWELNVSTGTRLFQVTARDNRGNVTTTPFQTITLTSP